MKKIILAILGVILCVIATFNITDRVLVSQGKPPLFVIKTKTYDNGLSYESYGAGYKVFCYHNNLKDENEYVIASYGEYFDEYYYENEMANEFYCQVVDTDAEYLYVRPLLNQSERSVSDLFTISRVLQPEALIDDYMLVEYKGRISTSYPASVNVTNTKLFPMMDYTVVSLTGANASGTISESCDVVTRYFECQTVLLHATIKDDKAMKKYDDTYFTDHALIILQLSENFDEVEHTIEGIFCEDDHFVIEMSRTSPTDGIIAPTTYYLLIEVDKDLALNHPTAILQTH